jgi:hypothetical protein
MAEISTKKMALGRLWAMYFLVFGCPIVTGFVSFKVYGKVSEVSRGCHAPTIRND